MCRSAGRDACTGKSRIADVAAALLEQRGVEVDRHLIQIDSPIRSLGRYLVPVRLAAGLEASVMLDVVEQEDEPEPAVEEEDAEAEEPGVYSPGAIGTSAAVARKHFQSVRHHRP